MVSSGRSRSKAIMESERCFIFIVHCTFHLFVTFYEFIWRFSLFMKSHDLKLPFIRCHGKFWKADPRFVLVVHCNFSLVYHPLLAITEICICMSVSTVKIYYVGIEVSGVWKKMECEDEKYTFEANLRAYPCDNPHLLSHHACLSVVGLFV